MKIKHLWTLLITNLLFNNVFAAKESGDGLANFWDDYQSTEIKYKVDLTGNFMGKTNSLVNAIWGLIKIAYFAAIVITMIAFVVATFSLVVHSDDNLHRKIEARHELMGALITLAILGSVGLIYQLIIALLSL